MASFPLTKEAFDFVAETSLKLKNVDVENYFTAMSILTITFSLLFIWIFYEMFMHYKFVLGVSLGDMNYQTLLAFVFLFLTLWINVGWSSYALHLAKNTEIVVEELSPQESQALENSNPNAGPLDFYKSFYKDSDAEKLKRNQRLGTNSFAIFVAFFILYAVICLTWEQHPTRMESAKKNIINSVMFYIYIIAYIFLLIISVIKKNFFISDLKF